MNWEALGAIGELAGAIGVIATLGYLAIQIRQNTSAVQSAAAQTVHENFAAWYSSAQGDSRLLGISSRPRNAIRSSSVMALS